MMYKSTSYSGDELAHKLALDTAGKKGVVVRSWQVKAGTLLRDRCLICNQKYTSAEDHFHFFKIISNV